MALGLVLGYAHACATVLKISQPVAVISTVAIDVATAKATLLALLEQMTSKDAVVAGVAGTNDQQGRGTNKGDSSACGKSSPTTPTLKNDKTSVSEIIRNYKG